MSGSNGHGDSFVARDIHCPCGQSIHIRELPHVGDGGKCPKCGRPFAVEVSADGTPTITWYSATTPVLVLDMDGTIRYSKSGPFVLTADDVGVYPEVPEVLDKFIEAGYVPAAITNQASVAMGQTSLIDAQDAIVETVQQLEGRLKIVVASFGHENATHENFRYRSLLRKPGTGGLAVVEHLLLGSGYVPDWDKSIVVGDSDIDKQMAEAAKVEFVWAWEFFKRPHPSEGRSPLCRYCRGEDDGVEPRPVVPADGQPAQYVHQTADGTGNLVPCEDQVWYRG